MAFFSKWMRGLFGSSSGSADSDTAVATQADDDLQYVSDSVDEEDSFAGGPQDDSNTSGRSAKEVPDASAQGAEPTPVEVQAVQDRLERLIHEMDRPRQQLEQAVQNIHNLPATLSEEQKQQMQKLLSIRDSITAVAERAEQIGNALTSLSENAQKHTELLEKISQHLDSADQGRAELMEKVTQVRTAVNEGSTSQSRLADRVGELSGSMDALGRDTSQSTEVVRSLVDRLAEDNESLQQKLDDQARMQRNLMYAALALLVLVLVGVGGWFVVNLLA